MPAKRFTIAAIAAALRKHGGLIPRAADELKTSRQSIHERIDRSPELKAVLLEIEEDMKTDARGAISDALKAKDMPTVRWFAERKMRDEGFGTKIETAIDAGQIERIAEAIAKSGGLAALRAIKASISNTVF